MKRALAILGRGLRDGTWISQDRVTAMAPLLLGLLVLAGAWLVWLHPDWPSDYRSFWAASRLTLDGTPDAAYDTWAHRAAQDIAPDQAGMAFFYPPVFLLICWPMALLPFGWSELLFDVLTSVLWALSLRQLVPGMTSRWFAPVAAMPAVWMNLAAGQTGLLTATLLNFGLAWLDRAPVSAGICLGLIVFKPQFGIVLPVLLVSQLRWRTLTVAAATVLAFTAASIAAFGTAPWRAFLAHRAEVDRVLAIGMEAPGKMISLLGILTTHQVSTLTGYLVQAGLSLLVCLVLAAVQRRFRAPLSRAGLVCICVVLASPWLHRYDLVLLLPAACWIVIEGAHTGFLAWEKPLLLLLYWLPLIYALPGIAGRPPADLVLFAMLLWLVCRRASSARRGGRAPA
jgi:hypothetical protein